METILTILFLVAAAIIHSFMKKKEEKEADTWLDDVRPGERDRQRPGRPALPRAGRPQSMNWEEELRRFLEGDKPAPAPPPSPVTHREPTPRPPPLVRSPPTVVRAPTPSVFQPPPSQTASYKSNEGRGLPVHMPLLTESAQAYQRASQIESKAEEHLRQAARHVSLHTRRPAERAPVVPLNEALALLRTRQSLRTAVIALVVLGPPKAMEAWEA